jgi:3-hydroxyisobutyrate dehydrogenase-like beta-hydroxyacid dehydrogenase
MTNDKASVSVLGLGAMGRALAGALLAAGHPTTVWNRTPGRADALVAEGATLAATAADAVERSALALVCLLDYDSVDEVLATTDPAGRTVVNLTNGAPAQARATATSLTARGAAYVDGGIMATPPMIGAPDAFILYSGDRAAFERAEPALAALARPVFVGEDAGLASLHDLALLTAMYGMFAGARHAVAFLRSEDVGAGPFTTELMIPWLQAMMTALPEFASTDGSPDSAHSSAAMQIVGIRNMLAASREQGVEDELAGHLHAALYDLQAAV